MTFPSERILYRDDYRCSYCGADLLATLDSFLSAVVDHVTPRSRGGPDHPTNMAAACFACDRIKSGRPARCVADGQRIIERQRTLLLPRFHTLVAAHRDVTSRTYGYRVETAVNRKDTDRP